jgi:hypothetical protein
MAAPALTSPSQGATLDGLPTFTWNGVTGAAKYEFQLAGTGAFAPALFDITTLNKRAAVTKVLLNGTYYWRVRGISATGVQGPWSTAASFDNNWSDVAAPQSPADGATLTYPEPILLNWTSIPGAQKYDVTIATDPQLQSAVAGYPTATDPTETDASAFSPGTRLAPGTYYWGVTPIDAEGNMGTPSPVYSFNWNWDVSTTLTVTDLDPSAEVFDPQFSWTPIEGAAYYEVEVNSDPSWASGSKVCCNTYSVATSLTPKTLLPADTYYWRVRPYDASGHPGAWTQFTDPNASPQDTFTISYDPDLTGTGGPTSIQNLSLRDSSDSAVATASSVDTPIVGWDPVPGASHYEVEVTPWDAVNSLCNWSSSSGHWDNFTAATWWTPLGSGWNFQKPFSNTHSVATDTASLTAGMSYCVRVRAERSADTGGHTVYGDYTYLGDGASPSFTFSGYPTGGACTPSCTANYLGSSDYLLPANGSSNPRLPLFTWNPISGKQSYFVLVATDPNFQNVIDYAFTQVPAYAPRTGSSGLYATYKDTQSLLYWAVLPATGLNGSGAVGDPVNSAAKHNFQKQSIAPSLLTPVDTSTVDTQPTFQWTPVEGAHTYHLQVATDSQFGTMVENVVVAESSYTSNTTFPSGPLYWRVQAFDVDDTTVTGGQSWSPTGTFTKSLPMPDFTGITNPTSGEQIPIWQWNPVPGAISYDFDLTCPGTGTCTDGTNADTTAETLISMSGVGPFQWRVRANFPVVSSTTQTGGSGTALTGILHGAYTAQQTFQRTIAAPGNPQTSIGGARDFSFSWNPKLGAKTYKWEVSTAQATNADGTFATPLESGTTENTSVAPLLSYQAYLNGGILYWHVAAKDADGNQGAFTSPQVLSLPALIKLTASPASIIHAKSTTGTVYAKDAQAHLISGAVVKASGAGITAVSKTTGTGGKVTFTFHPTKAGKITLTGTKSGCQPGSLTITVF